MTTRPPKPAGSSRSWPVPAALVALSVIPLIAGTLRLVQLAGGPQLMPADERIAALPQLVVVHIVGAAAYALVGALQFVRLGFGSAMVASLVLGVTAIRRRDIAAHRAWMIRAYAIALAAGTQAFTEGIGGALFRTGELRGDLAKGAAWVINLAVAEWVIRRPARPAPRRPRRAVALVGASS